MISGIPRLLGFAPPECELLVFTWCLGGFPEGLKYPSGGYAGFMYQELQVWFWRTCFIFGYLDSWGYGKQRGRVGFARSRTSGTYLKQDS